MAIYFNIETNEYPRFQGDLELLGWVAGTELPENWVEVIETEPDAIIGENETLIEELPVEIDGVWTQTWGARSLTDDEAAFRNAPFSAKEKLAALGLTDLEIMAISRGLIH